MRAPTVHAGRLSLLCALLLLACQGVDLRPNDRPVSDADRARYVTRRVEDAQAFRIQGRFTAAEHQLRLALGMDPGHARANALLARTLHDLGRDEEAAGYAARAQALSKGPAAPPDTPLVPDASGILFVLLPPESDRHGALGLPGEWEDLHVPRMLAKRIRTRLPKAGVTETAPASVKEAEEWLRLQAPRAVISVRVDEARCGESAKDGPYALVALTVAAARSGVLPDQPARVRATDDDPALPPACTDTALSRALEAALELPGIEAALRAPPQTARGKWTTLAVQALFPVLDPAVLREIDRGRAEAQAHAAAPPEPADVLARAQRERAQEGARDAARGPAPAGSDEAALEAEVATERRRRDELLLALQIDELAQRAPTAEEIAVLRTVAIRDPEAEGPRLARSRAAGGAVEERVLYAPDGRILARFYFRSGDELLLREEDTDADGAPDRWTAYSAGRPHEVWEDRGASGHVNAHLLLAPDGVSTERIEIDMDGNGHPEAVFHYARGVLVAGERDTNGDGALDRFERFESDGDLASRDEDLDGDGTIDVHSEFQAGKLLRREIRNPALVETLSSRPPVR